MLLSLLFAACGDEWTKHYESAPSEMEGISNETIFAYLEGNTDYSAFVSLLKETGLAEELDKGNVYTVWAPTNSAMADLSGYSIEQKRLIAKSHVNSIALYETKLADGKMIKMLSGKNFILTKVGEDYQLDAKPVSTGQVCNNGVVYVLGGTILPKMNLLDYLLNSGEEYSTFRRELFSRTDTIFDLDNSFPLGFNEEGNQIYDSVFIYDNPILNKAAIGDENQYFTMMLPTNAAIDTAFYRHYRYLSRPLTAYDSVTYMDWILQALFFAGRLEPDAVANTTEPSSIFSIAEKEWRKDKQHIIETKTETSNGYIYVADTLYIPRNLIAKSIDFEFSKTYFTDFSQEDRDRFFKTVSVRGSDYWANWLWNSKNYLNHATTGASPNAENIYTEELSLEITLFEKNRFGVFVPASLSPGTYELFIATRPAYNPTLWVTMNGRVTIDEAGNPLGEFATGTPQTHDGVLRSAGLVKVTPEESSLPIKIKLLRYKYVSGTYASDSRIVLHSLRIQPKNTEY
jgi:uncharacterized surface protein with fasciclin (FAS1) repeats